jgi:hypothetical protein
VVFIGVYKSEWIWMRVFGVKVMDPSRRLTATRAKPRKVGNRFQENAGRG